MGLQNIVGFRTYGKIRQLYRKIHGSNIYDIRKDEMVSYDYIYSQIRSKEEYDKKYRLLNEKFRTVLNEKGLKNSKKKGYEGLIVPGKCSFCGCTAGFSVPVELNGLSSYRETAGCTGCGQVARVRVILSKCKKLCEDAGKKDVYMYESGGVKKLVEAFASDVVGSEYITSEAKSGETIKGVLHEDGHALSFDDNSFDLVISRDVFEHVNDFRQCLREMCRVMRTGGYALITIPWFIEKEKTIQRTKMKNGEMIYLEDPTYHWNPVTGKMDSLVFWDYGWDFIEELKKAGFSDSYVQTYFDTEKGYIGEIGTYFVAVK